MNKAAHSKQRKAMIMRYLGHFIVDPKLYLESLNPRIFY